jgi:DNA topoisomerase-1
MYEEATTPAAGGHGDPPSRRDAQVVAARERAKQAGLHYVAEPTLLPLTRRRAGRGFSFFDQHSRALSDARLKARLAALVVPPAWQDVRLARDPRAHIQAVGRDAAGRLQYRYHELWSDSADAVKAGKLWTLGSKLGPLCGEIEAQLRRQTVDQDFATACALALLDRGGLRVGYAEYSREDGGRGATTLTRKDVFLKDGVVRLRFNGKGGKRIKRSLEDAALARALGLLRKQPGNMLFRWREGGQDRCLSADDVNAFLRGRFSDTTSARDFRTFRASALALGRLQEFGAATGRERGRGLKAAIRASSDFLANTPNVARKSYVHPLVQSAFADPQFDPRPLFAGSVREGLARDETALMRLLAAEAN